MFVLPRRYREAIDKIDQTHVMIAHGLSAPTPTHIAVLGIAYRYQRPSVSEAILLKLAFMTSGLRAAAALLEAGFVTEQATLSRAVNEAQEDVTFLVLANWTTPAPALLARYLASFFAEDTTREALSKGQHPKGRDIPSRKEIQNFNARHDLSGSKDPHTAVGQTLAVSHVLSSFTHGAAPNVMELYDPHLRSFSTAGLPAKSSIVASHVADFENYVYRGLITAAVAAKALCTPIYAQSCFDYVKNYEAKFFAKTKDAP